MLTPKMREQKKQAYYTRLQLKKKEEKKSKNPRLSGKSATVYQVFGPVTRAELIRTGVLKPV